MDDKLKYFLYAASNLSFSKTASHFFISPAAVSKAIAKLEAQIGFALFERHHNSITLTAAGLDFYENAKFIATDYDNAIQAGQTVARQAGQQLTVGISSIYEARLLTSALNDLRKDHPGLRITVTHRSLEQLAQGVSDNNIDVAYSFGHMAETPNLQTTTLYHSTYMVGVSATSPVAQQKVLTPADLEPLVCGYYSQLTSRNAKRGISEQATRGGFHFKAIQQYDTMEALLLAVATGQCFSFFPDLWPMDFPSITLLPTKHPFNSYEFVEFEPQRPTQLVAELSQKVQQVLAAQTDEAR